jgi:hypothetical protein
VKKKDELAFWAFFERKGNSLEGCLTVGLHKNSIVFQAVVDKINEKK